MIKTSIFLLVLTLFTVHSKTHFRNESEQIKIALKNKFYNQISMKLLIHIFTKIGLSSDVQFLVTTLNRPCRRNKRKIIRKLRKNLMKIKQLQQAKKELFDSKGMVRIIDYILYNLHSCKRIRNGHRKVYRKIKEIHSKIRHLEKKKKKNHGKAKLHKKDKKSKEIQTTSNSSLFNNCSKPLPENMGSNDEKIELIKKIEKLSKKCIVLKRLCKEKERYCKKSRRVCSIMKDLIESSN